MLDAVTERSNSLLFGEPTGLGGEAIRNHERIHTAAPHLLSQVATPRRNNGRLGETIPINSIETKEVVRIPEHADLLLYSGALQ